MKKTIKRTTKKPANKTTKRTVKARTINPTTLHVFAAVKGNKGYATSEIAAATNLSTAVVRTTLKKLIIGVGKMKLFAAGKLRFTRYARTLPVAEKAVVAAGGKVIPLRGGKGRATKRTTTKRSTRTAVAA